MLSGNVDSLISFLRQPVTIIAELVPLEKFYQTRCLGMFIFLFIFLRQPVTILGELVPHERFSQTSGLNIYLKIYLYTVGFQEEREWLTAPEVDPFMVSLDFRLVFPCMEFSVNGEYNIKILAKNFSPLSLLHCYCQVASIFTFISDYSVKLLLLKCLR